MSNCNNYHQYIIILISLLFLLFFITLYLRLCDINSNFENKKYLSKYDYLESHKSKFYSLRSGKNEKSLISKINTYIRK